MKSKFKMFLHVSLLTLLLAFTPVATIAHGEEATTNETVRTTSVEDDDSVENKPEELKVRLEKRKTNLKTKLDAAKQARLKSRCKASQGRLSSISGRIKGLETSRTQVYQNTENRLTKLSEKLASKGLDVTELNTQITELHKLVDSFETELNEYKLAVADLAAMDCAADPTAFQASLEAARVARSETSEAAKAVRAYLKETIKPTLVELRSTIEKPVETEENE